MKRIIFFAGMLIIATSVFSQSRRAGDKSQVANSRERQATVKEAPQTKDSRRTSSSGTANRSSDVKRETRSVTNAPSQSRRSSSSGSVSTNRTSKKRSSTVNTSPRTPSTYDNRRNATETRPGTSTNSRRTSSGTYGKTERRSTPSGNVSGSTKRSYNAQDNRRGGNTSSVTRSASHSNSSRNRNITPRHTTHYYHPDRYHRSVTKVYHSRPKPIDYRRVHHVYRAPVHVDIVWTPAMYREYRVIYPGMNWNYRTGYRISTLSAYDALYYVGDVRRVYGRVTDVFYAWENDEYILYFGPQFPYHDFSVIIPGHIAERYSRRPERFFTGANVAVTGLITAYDGKPEVLVRRSHQIERY